MITKRWILTLISLSLFIGNLNAQVLDEEEELALAFGDAEFVSIATGRSQPIARAPAVASVITDADIKKIGATSLEEILETVPGLHVSVSPVGYNPIYVVRGIQSEFNPQVLVLINGIPITNQYLGNRSQVWGGFPVNNISRIEIIRGPGSAIFGADAFSGVVNIVTKTATDISGNEFGIRAGSFNTKDAWILHGSNIHDFEVAFSLQLHDTDGYEEVIDQDAQTGFDALFGTTASLAPGPINTKRDNVDARVDVVKGDWQFRLGYQGRRDMGTGVGISQALDPNGSGNSDRLNTDLTYHDTTYNDWDLTAQISYFDISAKSDLVINPPGAATPLGAFPSGVIGNPDVYERHTRLNLSAFYTGIDDHQLRLGAGYNYDDMYRTEESKNFFLVAGGLPVPLGSVVDVSNDPTSVFIQPHDREAYYEFLQDEWSFAPDWNMTAGVRHDHYSDFGDTINPRLALVWQTKYNMTSKLLYGHAFRAPSFAELYNINNPVAIGNPELDPETIDTIEIALNVQHTPDLSTGLSLFHYKMSDIIRLVLDNPTSPTTSTSTYQNTGNQTGHGFELEATWDVRKDFTLKGNFAFQDSKDEDTNSDAANAPQKQLYVRADWEFKRDWNLDGQANWVADRKRAAGDTRPEVDDYTTVDVTLRYKPENSPWEFALSGRNIFDEDVREPSPAPGLIPNDLPLAGSSYFVEAGYHL